MRFWRSRTPGRARPADARRWIEVVRRNVRLPMKVTRRRAPKANAVGMKPPAAGRPGWVPCRVVRKGGVRDIRVGTFERVRRLQADCFQLTGADGEEDGVVVRRRSVRTGSHAGGRRQAPGVQSIRSTGCRVDSRVGRDPEGVKMVRSPFFARGFPEVTTGELLMPLASGSG